MKETYSLLRSWALALVAVTGLLAVMLLANATAAEKGKVTVDRVEYKGWKNNLRLANGDAELIITLDVGPRVISYKLAAGKNVLKNFDEQMGKTGEAEWQATGFGSDRRI